MPCYTKATFEQRQRIPPGAFYYLKALPTEGVRNEFYDFLKKRGREVAATTMYSEVWRYDAVSAFLAKRAKRVQSLKEREPDVWLRQLRAWMLEKGYHLTVSAVSEYGVEKVMPSVIIRYFRMVLTELTPEDERMEVEKDVWKIKKLDIPVKENLIRNDLTLNFTRIPQPDIRAAIRSGRYYKERNPCDPKICGISEREISSDTVLSGHRQKSDRRISGLVPHRDPEERLSGGTDPVKEYSGQHRESLRLPPSSGTIFKYGYPVYTAGRIQDLYRLGNPEI